MLTTFLQDQGLSENEAKIYLSAYKLGVAPVSIIAKHAELNRTTAYGNIKNLLKKGLITKQMKADIEYFSAIEPQFFARYLEERRHRLTQEQEKFSQILPLFKDLKSPHTLKPQVRFFEGIEGIKQIHQHMINDGHPIYSFFPLDHAPKKIAKYVLSDFIKMKKKKQVYSKVIAPETPETQKLQKRDAKENRITYLIPKDEFPFEAEVTIFGDKVALIALEEPELIGILVESRSIARTLKSIFDLTCRALGKN